MSGDRRFVGAELSPKTFRFFAQRRYADRLTSQHIIQAAIVAYIMGDLVVTQEGYRVPTVDPDEGDPIVQLHDEAGKEVESFTLEDAALARELAEVEWERPRYLTRKPVDLEGGWGVREVASWLEEETGRRCSIHSLRALLRAHFQDTAPRAGRGGGKGAYYWHDPEGADREQLEEIRKTFLHIGPWTMTERERRHNSVQGAKVRRKKDEATAAEHREKKLEQGRRSAELDALLTEIGE